VLAIVLFWLHPLGPLLTVSLLYNRASCGGNVPYPANGNRPGCRRCPPTVLHSLCTLSLRKLRPLYRHRRRRPYETRIILVGPRRGLGACPRHNPGFPGLLQVSWSQERVQPCCHAPALPCRVEETEIIGSVGSAGASGTASRRIRRRLCCWQRAAQRHAGCMKGVVVKDFERGMGGGRVSLE
jgi:hypothetical protein